MKEAARWSAVVLFGLTGLYVLGGFPIHYYVTHEPPRAVATTIVIFGAAAFSAPFFIVAHSCLYRRYERVVTVALFAVGVALCVICYRTLQP